MLTRRQLMLSSAALGGAWAARRLPLPMAFAETPAPRLEPKTGKIVSVDFDIAERQTAMPAFGGKSLPLWTFTVRADFPVVRLQLGDILRAKVKNSLTRPGEHVTIHWHGLRIANAQDGVAYMTQPPIQPGSEATYEFAPPDTGTFFFHTHCNSVEHFGRGLIGALIVDGDEVEPADQDLVLMMKDWRIAPDGTFLPFSTDEGAAKAGTAGTVRSINGATKPVMKVKASGNIRLRLLNVDSSRIPDIGIVGAEAAIIAIDGNACQPMPLQSWRLGPASRLDILMRAPKPGATARIVDYFAPQPVVLAEFAAEGDAIRTDTFKAHPLRAGRFTPVDVKTAGRLTFDLSTTATGESIAALGNAAGFEIGSLCLSKRTFWAINKQSWASADHSDSGPPLATLKAGGSYVFVLKNLTANAHPIHIHGHTFEVLSSSLRKLPRHRADTVLVLPRETVEIAFKADNIGKWMFHCHILEHQETGMMGYLAVV